MGVPESTCLRSVYYKGKGKLGLRDLILVSIVSKFLPRHFSFDFAAVVFSLVVEHDE